MYQDKVLISNCRAIIVPSIEFLSLIRLILFQIAAGLELITKLDNLFEFGRLFFEQTRTCPQDVQLAYLFLI
jgi:hypothetical protein